MKIVSDALAPIATTLGLEFIRSVNLSHANVDVFYSKEGKDLMIYNGHSTITTQFDGAMVIDIIQCEIYLLTIKPTIDPIGTEIDTLTQITKEYANKTYFELAPNVPMDIQPYTLVAVEPFPDKYAGHLMTIGIPFYNEGC